MRSSSTNRFSSSSTINTDVFIAAILTFKSEIGHGDHSDAHTTTYRRKKCSTAFGQSKISFGCRVIGGEERNVIQFTRQYRLFYFGVSSPKNSYSLSTAN